MAGHRHPGERIAAVKALVELSRLDLLCSDLYLGRAETVLSAEFPRQQFIELSRDKEQLPGLTRDLRGAAEKGDWGRVRELAKRAGHLRERVAPMEDVLTVAESVYGSRTVRADGTALGMSGVVGQPAQNLARGRVSSISHLQLLAAQDSDWSPFYRRRIDHFESLQFDPEGGASPRLNPDELRHRILEAADRGDFDRVRQLTEAIPNSASSPSGRFRAPLPSPDEVRSLNDPFPARVLDAIRSIGLNLENLPLVMGLNGYLSCCCADRAKLPDEPLGETERDASQCTCGHPCPPDVAPRLRENLDLLLGHSFITSAGNRYLPWFGAETVLVETFPEDEPDTRTPLSEQLHLDHRQRAPRLYVEDALLTHGPAILREIGLDPFEYQLVCIPFDVYLRLASKYGWGQRELWTHFDGYQVTRQLKLWGLVGGHARFGGSEDLCSLARDYSSEHLTVRFAIVRRRRFLAREEPDR